MYLTVSVFIRKYPQIYEFTLWSLTRHVNNKKLNYCYYTDTFENAEGVTSSFEYVKIPHSRACASLAGNGIHFKRSWNKTHFNRFYSDSPTFAEVLLATKHTSMDCGNYVRSSTWRPEVEGTEDDDGELEDSAGDEDDDKVIINIKILWCWRTIISIIINITISRYMNNSGQNTMPGWWFRWESDCDETDHPALLDIQKAAGVKDEQPLRRGATTPNTRDIFWGTLQNGSRYVLVHNCFKLTS